ncbi:DUF2283 domain-containing protein [Sphingomonas sp. M1-B02]|uniref:DUF2283 domain-containing protein n=1 Tax=Sphingomonas sp. M1-B02 TaxID=3114300 RepID=UPI00224053CE|nr:DUF2283 domain-containing protein [Sphingomonas sp. S6-11]UZK66840.1 DUF2283 domain-containing protein [Sphingomonas sp. S6-11]
MKTTRYFEEQVLRQRPYIEREWCRSVIEEPVHYEVQDDGRIRFWGAVIFAGRNRAAHAKGGHARRRRDSPQRLPRPQLQATDMKLHYYAETDSLCIELKAGPSVETREIASGVNADLDADGTMIGLDIDGASTGLDLTTLETVALPLTRMKAA